MATDRIPTEAELMEKIEARTAYREANDPRKKYKVTYDVNGTTMTEMVMANNERCAEETVKYQCSLVGWQLKNMSISLA